jgi:hypothetical protein
VPFGAFIEDTLQPRPVPGGHFGAFMRYFVRQLSAFSALCLIALPLAASEWDSTWAGDSAAAVGTPANYIDATPLADRPSWLLEDRGRMTRLSPSGEVLARVTDATYTGNTKVLRNLPDGGLLLSSSTSAFVRLDAGGRFLWYFDSRTATGTSLWSTDVAADDSGSVWYFDSAAQRLHKVGADGQIAFTRSAAELGLRVIKSIAVSPSGQRALVVGFNGDPGAPIIASTRLSHSGSVLSTWSGPAAGGSAYGDFRGVMLDDENAFVVAIDGESRLLVARHDAAGNTTLPQPPSLLGSFPGIAYVRTMSNGFMVSTSHSISISHGWEELRFFSATGQLLSEGRQEEFVFINPETITEDGDGALWAIAQHGGPLGSQSTSKLHKLTPGSDTRIPLPDTTTYRAFVAATPHGGSVTIADGGQLFSVDAAGTFTSLQPYSAVTMPLARVMGTTADDGTSYIVQRTNTLEGSPVGATISRIARDGSVQWSVPVPQDIRFVRNYSRLNAQLIAANASRLCYLPEASTSVYCHDAATGQPLARTVLPEGSYDALALDADNRVLLYRFLGGAAPVAVLGADYALLPQSAYSAAMLAPGLYHPAGYELYFDAGAGTTVATIRREARITHAATPAVAWQLEAGQRPAMLLNGQPAVLVLDDGSALLLAFGDSTPLTLQRLNADGTLGYRRSFDGLWKKADLKLAGNQVLVVMHRDAVYFDPGETRLLGIALDSGAINWQSTITQPAVTPARPSFFTANTAGELFVDTEAGHALWWTADTLDFNVQKIRLADGALMARTDFPCTTHSCQIDRVHMDTLGTTLLPSVIRRERDLFAAQVRADQEVLEGAWYQPKTSGQGVLFDYLPENRTWFGTWHTSDLSGANGRAGLRWFTLQGQADAESTQADLGIYLASGGKFDSGPRISSTRIGDATLKFDDCSSANLEYRITAGELAGHSGSIPLRLLTPQSASCAAIGQPPTAPTTSTRNGISSSFSGTWYQPDSSGQGLEVAVRPELGNGSIVAGWFTFDPEGSADDPLAQHWFTLQGDLSTAANGSLTLPIFRTIGGMFDLTGTRNSVRVGEATWSFLDCHQSQLSYRFDDSGVAGAYTGRIGTIALQRIGECATP